MGGSGGFWRPREGEDLSQKIRQAEQETRDAVFEQNVAELIAGLLTEYNQRNRDMDAVNRHLATIHAALEGYVEGTIDLRYGGSLSRHTYVDGFSDTDILVLIDNSELANATPLEVQQYFFERLRQRLPTTDIVLGRLAVTLNYSDAQVQLLPAMRNGDGFKIADETGQAWIDIKPRAFAEKLTDVNQRCANKVVPTIKIAKSILAPLSEDRKPTGYHCEALAIDIFKRYNGPFKVKDMLQHFFSESKTKVLMPIRDSTGQTVHVDDKLGGPSSSSRYLVSDSLARITRKINNAEGAKDLDAWKDILIGER